MQPAPLTKLHCSTILKEIPLSDPGTYCALLRFVARTRPGSASTQAPPCEDAVEQPEARARRGSSPAWHAPRTFGAGREKERLLDGKAEFLRHQLPLVILFVDVLPCLR